MKESEVVKACVEWAHSQGWRPDRNHVGVFATQHGAKVHIGHKGQPDWRFVRGNPLLYFECEFKRPGEKPRKEQMEYMALLRYKGIPCFWADSLESFKQQVVALFG